MARRESRITTIGNCWHEKTGGCEPKRLRDGVELGFRSDPEPRCGLEANVVTGRASGADLTEVAREQVASFSGPGKL
jgi:hypothetical protein